MECLHSNSMLGPLVLATSGKAVVDQTLLELRAKAQAAEAEERRLTEESADRRWGSISESFARSSSAESLGQGLRHTGFPN